MFPMTMLPDLMLLLTKLVYFLAHTQPYPISYFQIIEDYYLLKKLCTLHIIQNLLPILNEKVI